MENINYIEKEIAELEEIIKISKEKEMSAKSRLKELEKYRGLNFYKFSERQKDKYVYGLYNQRLFNTLRNLVLLCCVAKEELTVSNNLYIELDYIPKVKELNANQLLFCNNFIDELLPIIEKYILEGIELNKGD